jgi:peptidoglycan/xylan/chitin deacetylase (PgdA/CDA1 family)
MPEDNHHQILNWGQLREICSRGIECGSHSHTHAKLDALPRASAVQEIRESKEILEDNLKQTVTSFAYPYGYYNRGLQNIVEKAGYLCACAVDNSMSSAIDNWFALARLLVRGDTSVADLARQLNRSFSPVSRKIGQLVARAGRIRERVSEGIS